MRSKYAVPIISVCLVISALLAAFVAVACEKKQEEQLGKDGVVFSTFYVDGNRLECKVNPTDSLGLKICSYSYEFVNGTLKFRLYGNKDFEISKYEKREYTLSITAPGEINQIVFVSIDDKGEETEIKKSFQAKVLLI